MSRRTGRQSPDWRSFLAAAALDRNRSGWRRAADVLLGPSGVFSDRPAGIDRPAPHSAPCLGIADGPVNVSEYQKPDPEREPIVNKGGAGPPGQRRQPDEVHDDARPQQHEYRGARQPGVQLLAGVELADHDGVVAPRSGAQPMPVRPGEAVEP